MRAPKTKHGPHLRRLSKVTRPKFMAGTLFDVWFYWNGRDRERHRISVTTEPESWRGEKGRLKLDALVLERFEGRLIDARRCSLVVTSRPNEKVVVEIKWLC